MVTFLFYSWVVVYINKVSTAASDWAMRRTHHISRCTFPLLKTGLWIRWGLLTPGGEERISILYLSRLECAVQVSDLSSRRRRGGTAKCHSKWMWPKGVLLLVCSAAVGQVVLKKIDQKCIHDKMIYSFERSDLSETDIWGYLQILHYLYNEYFKTRVWTGDEQTPKSSADQQIDIRLNADGGSKLTLFLVFISSPEAWERWENILCVERLIVFNVQHFMDLRSRPTSLSSLIPIMKANSEIWL